jgi:hypothetical protein
MGKTTKALQQLVARGSLDFAREDVNPATNRAARVVTTEEWVREYTERSRDSAGPAARQPKLDNVRTIQPRRKPSSSERYWQELAERQAVEILRLQARIAELEAR